MEMAMHSTMTMIMTMTMSMTMTLTITIYYSLFTFSMNYSEFSNTYSMITMKCIVLFTIRKKKSNF